MRPLCLVPAIDCSLGEYRGYFEPVRIVLQLVAEDLKALILQVEGDLRLLIHHLHEGGEPLLGEWYTVPVQQKSLGRARIAVLQRVFSMMHRMLLSGTPYR